VNANIKEENSKQINDIKSKLTKFKNSLKETKEQLEENLYQKLKQFSITYDRSLINEYFADFQVK
jgi:lipopolysaccharide biosynthesis glycosyltransferase